ncbi:hypothetical protein [Sabulicella glaciei]|uniref:Uncharacterized protein n=1 Tax=Sabulicella glaciei TaxID=2984948 RepID=A0ABT3P197_9PROT|nr:hypothetical protein [Roseococcus sp. MDT2-1-1]MCW8088195.1 hypothetical protein [Roseococcus sp. MDT2-1-1]
MPTGSHDGTRRAPIGPWLAATAFLALTGGAALAQVPSGAPVERRGGTSDATTPAPPQAQTVSPQVREIPRSGVIQPPAGIDPEIRDSNVPVPNPGTTPVIPPPVPPQAQPPVQR